MQEAEDFSGAMHRSIDSITKQCCLYRWQDLKRRTYLLCSPPRQTITGEWLTSMGARRIIWLYRFHGLTSTGGSWAHAHALASSGLLSLSALLIGAHDPYLIRCSRVIWLIHIVLPYQVVLEQPSWLERSGSGVVSR